jgi:hypothetical protein
MRKFVIVLAVLAMPGGAFAMQPREQVDRLLGCTDIADPQARLACFDANAPALREAVAIGAVSINRRPQVVVPVRSTVTSATRSNAGYWYLRLENGQNWQSEEAQPTRRPPAPGTAVVIDSGMIGGYWLRTPSGGRYKVRFIQGDQ